MAKITPIQRLQWAVDNVSMAPQLRKELAGILRDLETEAMLPKVLADAKAALAARH